MIQWSHPVSFVRVWNFSPLHSHSGNAAPCTLECVIVALIETASHAYEREEKEKETRIVLPQRDQARRWPS